MKHLVSNKVSLLVIAAVMSQGMSQEEQTTEYDSTNIFSIEMLVFAPK